MRTRQWISITAALALAGALAACGDNSDSRQAAGTTEQQNTAAGQNTPEQLGNAGGEQGNTMPEQGTAMPDQGGQTSSNATMPDEGAAGGTMSGGGGQTAGAGANTGTTQGAQQAIAMLEPTQGNDVKGTVRFSQATGGVKVTAHVTGLTPGKHGYHVHVNGDCSAPDGKSAGTHFNFEGNSQNPPADIDRITGNLGELEADDSGEASASKLLPTATMSGEKSIIGRAVIVHAKANDPSQPPIGAAGARQACGVIKAADASSGLKTP